MEPKYKLQESLQSIVFVGGFNALNFTTDWLFNYDLISKNDYDNSKVVFLQAGQIRTELPWAIIQVGPVDDVATKLSISSTDEGSSALFSDLVMSLIEAFITASISGFGINFRYQIVHDELEEWHDFGHKLLPKKLWKNVFLDDAVDYPEETFFGMNNVGLKIDNFFPSVEPLEEGKTTELNISVRPIKIDEGKASKTTEVSFNYHFPILEKFGMDMVLKTMKTHHSKIEQDSPKFLHQLIVEEI